jgi:hypothetical protein
MHKPGCLWRSFRNTDEDVIELDGMVRLIPIAGKTPAQRS